MPDTRWYDRGSRGGGEVHKGKTLSKAVSGKCATFCLLKAGISMKDVDRIAYSYLPKFSN